MATTCRTVGDLKKLLAKFPDQLLVKVVTTDGNAMVHEDIQVEVQEMYTEAVSREPWVYDQVSAPFLEFK